MWFFEELKRRNVFRVATAYVAVAWLIIQVGETLFPVFGLSDDAIRIVVISLTYNTYLRFMVDDPRWKPWVDSLNWPWEYEY